MFSLVSLTDRREQGRPGARRSHGPRAGKMHGAGTTGSAETSRPSLHDGLTAYTCSCVFEICQNVRTGGSDQPPVAGSEPDRAQRPRACRGAWDRSGVFLQPEQLHGLRARTSKEGSWMMAQKDLVVAGVDVAKDKVDACTRALGSKQMFASTEEGRREFVEWLRRHKVAKVVMEASGGYEREWAKVARTAKIDVRIVDPRRVRSFAQSAGRLAKNDSIDADTIAWFAETFNEATGQTYDAAREKLQQMVNARQATKDMLIRLTNQGEHELPAAMRRLHTRIAKAISTELSKLEAEISALI